MAIVSNAKTPQEFCTEFRAFLQLQINNTLARKQSLQNAGFARGQARTIHDLSAKFDTLCQIRDFLADIHFTGRGIAPKPEDEEITVNEAAMRMAGLVP
jgi:hypothetical protein